MMKRLLPIPTMVSTRLGPVFVPKVVALFAFGVFGAHQVLAPVYGAAATA
jgi:hypothetical protein